MKRIICFFAVILICCYYSFNDFNPKKEVVVKRYDKLMTAAIEAGFKDEKFYACITDSFGKTSDVTLTDEELKSIKELDCTAKGITDVSGLEKLTGLTKIILNENDYSGAIDFSANKELVEIRLNKNKLTKVNLSSNEKLEKLILSANPTIEEIDVSNNSNLKYFYASSCNLSNDALKLGNISSLKSLNLYQNKLSEIDLSNNKELVDLNLSLNKLDEEDVDFNDFPILKRIYASGNIFKNVDLSNNLELTDANFYSNYDSNGVGLKTINVNGCSKLQYLLVSLNHLTNVDLSTNINLKHLYASGNNLTSIDLSKNTNLYDIDLYSNKLESIILPSSSTLQKIKLSVNRLKSLDVTKVVNLKKLYVSSNELTNLDLSSNLALESANVAFNMFTANVKFANDNKISYLWIDDSMIPSYDFSKFPYLKDLGTVHSDNILVYGTRFNFSDIKAHIPSSIDVSSYALYNTFNGMPEKYKIYEEIPEDVIVDFDDAMGEPDNNKVAVNYVDGKIGSTYKLQVLAEDTSNSLLSGYDGKYSYNGFYTLIFGNITSNKYVIDEEKAVIGVAGDSDDVILSNINNNLKNANMDIDGDKLRLSYNGEILKEFTLNRVNNPPTGILEILIVMGLLISGVIGIVIYRKKLENKV